MAKKEDVVVMASQHTEQTGVSAMPHPADGEGQKTIPFGTPARVGNFKLWRSKKTFGDGDQQYDIEQINISTLDGSWQVTIPATFVMFRLISELYGDLQADQRMEQLSTFFSNMLYASSVANGYFQKAVTLCATAYAHPGLLREEDKDHESFMQDVSGLAEGFLAWSDEYEKHVAANEPTAEELKQDEIAAEMLNEIAGGEGG